MENHALIASLQEAHEVICKIITLQQNIQQVSNQKAEIEKRQKKWSASLIGRFFGLWGLQFIFGYPALHSGFLL